MASANQPIPSNESFQVVTQPHSAFLISSSLGKTVEPLFGLFGPTGTNGPSSTLGLGLTYGATGATGSSIALATTNMSVEIQRVILAQNPNLNSTSTISVYANTPVVSSPPSSALQGVISIPQGSLNGELSGSSNFIPFIFQLQVDQPMFCILDPNGATQGTAVVHIIGAVRQTTRFT